MNNGIPYFPFDVHLDDKFKLIEAEFGLTGFSVVVKLYQKIYGEQGYYCEWTNDVALLFSRNAGLGCGVVSEIVSAAVRRGIFDADVYEKYRVLTSRGIQKRYFEAVSRRVNVEVKKEYLLIQVTPKYKNVSILNENAYIFEENACRNGQSKVKKSKVKESKVKESKAEETDPAAAVRDKELERIIGEYQNNIAPITPMARDVLSDWMKQVEPDVISYAISEAVSHNARNLKYIEGILRSHANAGRTTLAAVTMSRGHDASARTGGDLPDALEIERIMQKKYD